MRQHNHIHRAAGHATSLTQTRRRSWPPCLRSAPTPLQRPPHRPTGLALDCEGTSSVPLCRRTADRDGWYAGDFRLVSCASAWAGTRALAASLWMQRRRNTLNSCSKLTQQTETRGTQHAASSCWYQNTPTRKAIVTGRCDSISSRSRSQQHNWQQASEELPRTANVVV